MKTEEGIVLASLEQGAKFALVSLTRHASLPGFFDCEDVFSRQRFIIHRNQFITDMPQIQSRFSKQAFDRVAHILGYILREFPGPVPIDPGGLSNETLARCIREAIQAKKQYGWTHPSIDEIQFKMYADAVVISSRDGTLKGGSRQTIHHAAATVGNPLPVTNETIVEADESTLRSVCKLLSDGALMPRPNFVVVGSSATLRNILESQYDVVFEPVDGTNKFRIL